MYKYQVANQTKLSFCHQGMKSSFQKLKLLRNEVNGYDRDALQLIKKLPLVLGWRDGLNECT